jgi:hypothetical protein
MKRASLAVSVSAPISLMMIGLPVRADVITYQCHEKFGSTAVRIDSQTLSAKVDDPAGEYVGTAQLSDATIVITIPYPELWTIEIDRAGGGFSDSNGHQETCVLGATAQPAQPAAASLNRQITHPQNLVSPPQRRPKPKAVKPKPKPKPKAVKAKAVKTKRPPTPMESRPTTR